MSPTSYHCSTPRSFVSAKVRRISETTKPSSESQLRKSHEQLAVGYSCCSYIGAVETLVGLSPMLSALGGKLYGLLYYFCTVD